MSGPVPVRPVCIPVEQCETLFAEADKTYRELNVGLTTLAQRGIDVAEAQVNLEEFKKITRSLHRYVYGH